jgi:hypothetical protein
MLRVAVRIAEARRLLLMVRKIFVSYEPLMNLLLSLVLIAVGMIAKKIPRTISQKQDLMVLSI